MVGRILDQKELDEKMCDVLFNATKTRAFLKRLRASKPDKWKHVYGNVSLAFNLLTPKQVRVTLYLVGIFDPEHDDNWPWHCHYEDGIYLSSKHRPCKRGKAAEFKDKNEAREFFHQWKGKKHYKMELIEFERYEMVPSVY